MSARTMIVRMAAVVISLCSAPAVRGLDFPICGEVWAGKLTLTDVGVCRLTIRFTVGDQYGQDGRFRAEGRACPSRRGRVGWGTPVDGNFNVSFRHANRFACDTRGGGSKQAGRCFLRNEDGPDVGTLSVRQTEPARYCRSQATHWPALSLRPSARCPTQI